MYAANFSGANFPAPTFSRTIGFTVTVEKIHVFTAIRFVSRINSVLLRRYYWRNFTLTKSETVYNVMRRNRFKLIIDNIHCVHIKHLQLANKYNKLRPLVRFLAHRF